MELNKNDIIRTILIILGFSLIIYTIFSFIDLINPIIEKLLIGNFMNLNLNFDSMTNLIWPIVISFILLYIGFFWDNVLKHLTKILVSLSIFVLTLTIFLYAINSNSTLITNSIQPSIDYVVAYSLDDMLNSQINISDEDTINLILSKNLQIEKVYVNNLTTSQANLFSKTFELNTYNNNDKIKFSKILISAIYDEMLKNNPSVINAPLSLSFIKTNVENQGFDMNLIKLMSMTQLESLYSINDNAYLNIISSSNDEIKNIQINNITKTDVNLIWNNLNFNDNISYNSKSKIVQLILATVNNQKQNISDVPIPLTMIGSLIPNDFKLILNYDILSENMSLRSKNIENVRNLCIDKKIDIGEVCNMIMLTNYDYLMLNLNNLTKNMSLPINITTMFKDYNSLEKIDNTIKNKTSNWPFFIFLFLLIIGISILIYYLHFRLFKRELIKIHIPYFISKLNLINFIPSFIFFSIIYYFLVSEILLNFLINTSGNSNIYFIKDLPIIQTIIQIFNSIFIISLIYLILSIILYLGLYFMLKKMVKNTI